MNPLRLLLAFVLASLSTACAHDVDWPRGEPSQTYTLVNLHPDPDQRALYSVNYQRSGFIPRCTAVQIVDIDEDALVFRTIPAQETYVYRFHRTLAESIPSHLDKYFGPNCDVNLPATMSAIDQRGIERGKALLGMSKQGVLLAIGYPPEHATPSYDAAVWRYWINRFNTFTLHFEGERLIATKD